MGARRAHLVGSIPAATAADAMRLAVQRLGPQLDYLPDGETGERRNWVIGMIENFRAHPDFRLVKDGDWSDYDRFGFPELGDRRCESAAYVAAVLRSRGWPGTPHPCPRPTCPRPGATS